MLEPRTQPPTAPPLAAAAAAAPTTTNTSHLSRRRPIITITINTAATLRRHPPPSTLLSGIVRSPVARLFCPPVIIPPRRPGPSLLALSLQYHLPWTLAPSDTERDAAACLHIALRLSLLVAPDHRRTPLPPCPLAESRKQL